MMITCTLFYSLYVSYILLLTLVIGYYWSEVSPFSIGCNEILVCFSYFFELFIWIYGISLVIIS